MFSTFFPVKEAWLNNTPVVSEDITLCATKDSAAPVARSRHRLCEGLELRSPVVQGPLAQCDNPCLAAAVSQAGGLGCLSVPATIDKNTLRLRLTRIRQQTRHPVLLAFTAQFESESLLDCALESGFRHFQVFWWNGPRLTRRIQDAGGTVFWQVGTTGQGNDALQCGADVLIAQGTAAGGQVRSPHPLKELVEGLLALRSEPLSVIAGGGLADRRDVEAVLSWGASAAMLGTRFLLSEESHAPLRDKNRLVRAKTNKLLLDTRMIGDWPCAPRRRLPNGPDTDKPSLYAGCGLSRMYHILPAAQIVRALTPIPVFRV